MGYFNHIEKVKYSSIDSNDPFTFKVYNPDEKIGNKSMKDYLRFSVAYWHTFTEELSDPFGAGTAIRPWDKYSNPMDKAKARLDAAFELFELLNVEYFAFHDVDIAPEGDSLEESFKNQDIIIDLMKGYMKDSGVKLLWNTVNNFTHPRFVHGAATSPNADVFAYAAAKVKKGLEVGKELGAENYVFWGGREGYESLLNTNLELELDNLARFLTMAKDYAKEIDFNAQFLIEPKPKEPTTHQYDYDVQSSHAFLQKYSLDKHFKFNIEANHAILSGHTFEHELYYSRINNMLGSLDANQGNPHLGWDTDEFPTNLYSTTLAMYEVLKNGGLGSGGLNFDSKVRRTSFELDDLVKAHIVGMDSYAFGLKVANRLLEDRVLENIREERYISYTQGIGKDIVNNQTDFKKLEEYIMNKNEIVNKSDSIEVVRGIINQYIVSTI